MSSGGGRRLGPRFHSPRGSGTDGATLPPRGRAFARSRTSASTLVTRLARRPHRARPAAAPVRPRCFSKRSNRRSMPSSRMLVRRFVHAASGMALVVASFALGSLAALLARSRTDRCLVGISDDRGLPNRRAPPSCVRFRRFIRSSWPPPLANRTAASTRAHVGGRDRARGRRPRASCERAFARTPACQVQCHE